MGLRRRQTLPAPVPAHYKPWTGARSWRQVQSLGQLQYCRILRRRDHPPHLQLCPLDLRGGVPAVLQNHGCSQSRHRRQRGHLSRAAWSDAWPDVLQSDQLVPLDGLFPWFFRKPRLHGTNDGRAQGVGRRVARTYPQAQNQSTAQLFLPGQGAGGHGLELSLDLPQDQTVLQAFGSRPGQAGDRVC